MQRNSSTGRRTAGSTAPSNNASPPGTTTASSTPTSTATTNMQSQARMGQILDDQDHKRCSEGNHRALLAENLDQLRGLVKVLESDDWKYAPSSNPPFQPDSDFSASNSRW